MEERDDGSCKGAFHSKEKPKPAQSRSSQEFGSINLWLQHISLAHIIIIITFKLRTHSNGLVVYLGTYVAYFLFFSLTANPLWHWHCSSGGGLFNTPLISQRQKAVPTPPPPPQMFANKLLLGPFPLFVLHPHWHVLLWQAEGPRGGITKGALQELTHTILPTGNVFFCQEAGLFDPRLTFWYLYYTDSLVKLCQKTTDTAAHLSVWSSVC